LLDSGPGESLRRYAKHRRLETRARLVPSDVRPAHEREAAGLAR
jgi:hypothetical protein